jgi:hypothetical protein
VKVNLATLADAATQWCGKLNIVGTFDTINWPQFPAMYPHCAVVVGLQFEAIEAGQHNIKANFINEDGNVLLKLPEISPQIVAAPNGRATTLHYLFNMQPLRLDSPGEYSFEFAIDGKHELSLPLFVYKVGVPPGFGPAI